MQRRLRRLRIIEAGLARIPGFTTYLDNSILQFREGMRTGVVQPKLVVDVVVEQLDALIAQGVEKSTFYGPILAFPDSTPLPSSDVSPPLMARLSAPTSFPA